MYLVLRIFTSILFLILFTGILFMMFFSPKLTHTFSLPFEIHNAFPYKQTFGTGNIIRDEISYFEDIYSYSGSVTIEQQGDKNMIDVSDRILFSSLRNIGSSYEFNGDNFKITQQGIGEVYIDSQSQANKVFIFAVNTPIMVSLTGDDGNEIFTDIFLTPHMYLEFQPLRGKLLKNADRVRIDTIFKLGYIGERLSSDIQDTIFSRYIYGNESLFFTAYENILSRQVDAEEKLNDFGTNDIIKIPGLAMAQKYSRIFMNKEKKIIFYKNNILQGYIDIIGEKKASRKKISDLKKDIRYLESLDIQQYQDNQNIYYELLSLLSMSRDINAIEVKDIFYGVGNKVSVSLDPYFLYSYSLFSIYDGGGDISDVFFRNLVTLFGNFSSQQQERKVYEEYFEYFLEKSLIYELELTGEEKRFTKIVEIFSAFNYIAGRVYNDTIEQKVTGIFIYSELLQKIEDSLRVNFFVSERNTEGLLLVNNSVNFSIEMVQKLRKSSNIAFSFFSENKKYLDVSNIRDKNIISSIERSSELFSEYFTALENYEEYVSFYDISKRNALDIAIEQESEVTLSQEGILSYLGKFIGISYAGSSISIISNGYEIQNLNISGSRFSFKLYPESGNRMTDIVIDDVAQAFEYKLDVTENIWNGRFKTATEAEKDSYDFSRFFLITFIEYTPKPAIDIYIGTQKASSEDKTEVVFKRDILLGDNGEFRNIRSILDIQYKNITLVKNDTLYDVYITNTGLSIQSGGSFSFQKNYNGIFSAQYIINAESTNRYFTNIQSNFSENLDNGRNNLFGGNKVLFMGNINKEDFGNIFSVFANSLENFETFYATIMRLPNISDISFQYNFSTGKMSYKFEKKGKNYIISYEGNQIDQILQDTTKLLSIPISPQQLPNYID